MFYGAKGKIETIAYKFIQENNLWLDDADYYIIRSHNKTNGYFVCDVSKDKNKIVIQVNTKDYENKMIAIILHEYYEALGYGHEKSVTETLGSLRRLSGAKHTNMDYEVHCKEIVQRIKIPQIQYNFNVSWTDNTIVGPYKEIAHITDLCDGIIRKENKRSINVQDVVKTKGEIMCAISIRR